MASQPSPAPHPTRDSHLLARLIPGTIRDRLRARRDVILLMGLTFAAKPFGFVVQLLIASSFGAAAPTDAYFVGFFIATFLSSIGIQVFTTLVVPLAFDHAAKFGERATLGFLNAVLALFTAPLILFALVLLAAPRLAIAIAAPGFRGETLALAEGMTRLMAAGTILTGLGGYLSTLLNTRRVFWLPGIIPTVQAIVTIAGILALRHVIGPYALAVTFLATSAIAVIAQGVAALRLGLLRSIAPAWKDPFLARLAALAGPVLMSALIVQALFMVDKMMASGLPEGSVSALSYANTVNFLALQLFAGTFVTVLFTDLAAHIAAGDLAAFRASFQRDARYLLAMIVPFAVIAIVKSEEIVGILFGRGKFDQTAMTLTSRALVMYSIGLPMLGMNMLLARVFHSLKEMAARMAIDVAWLGANVGANLLLVRSMGVAGLALGTSIASATNIVLAMAYLRRRHGGIGEGAIVRALVESAAAGGAMAIVVAVLPAGRLGDWGAPRLERALALAAVGLAGIAVYAAALFALRRLGRRAGRRGAPGA
jgi:putative peptidoglycan lipid II flippase